MEGNIAIGWWIAAGVLVAAELATGTFYLLMLALGMVAAALAAHLDLTFSSQLIAAAIVGGGATLGWHLWRQRARRLSPVDAAARNFGLDIGERVHVALWNADGTARIDYRGSQWTASWRGEGSPQPGSHVILGIENNRLLLGR